MADYGKPLCKDCGGPFSQNIMKTGGMVRCGLCLQVESIVADDWDADFLKKLNEPLDGPRYG